ncbi:MAG TPA: hypothetical protein VF794_12685 [Archangium sp.]|uniref:LVIVD repeat-containing protein n=1 Tax=Archangium sp. TaxID=1872627 RepID=UPI002ED82A94
MNRLLLPRATLLAGVVTFLGCLPGPPPTDPPDASTRADASTDAGQQPTDEWDGSYVALPETGSNWTDPGLLSPCGFPAAGGNCEDFSTFDLSGCDPASLANADTAGLYLLNSRFQRSDGGYSSMYAYPFGFSSDGGTTAYLSGQPATEQRDGNTRLFSTFTAFADGGTRRTTMVTCAAPQAPEFTGCLAFCRNGRVTSRATFSSTRLRWRAGETEASGLELVSENRVELAYPADVYVTRGHAYVVSVNHRGQAGGLAVFDVSDKSAPVLKKTIQMSGDTYWNGVWAKDNALYVASSSKGVVVFDISNPADPQFVSTLGSSGHTVFVEGNRLYATGSGGVHIYDLTTPTHPVELARYAPDPDYPHDMFAVGTRLYVNYSGAGYYVADVKDPNNLVTLGTYSYAPFEQYSHATAVGTFGGRTISFMGGEGPGEHLRVLDVTDPAKMMKIGEFQLRAPVSIHNMVLSGKRLYLSWYQEGVRVLDVSNPTRPTQVAYYNTYRETDPNRGDYFDGAIGIRVPGDGYIYAVDTGRGLLILREK